MTEVIYIALGSNLGDRQQHILSAYQEIHDLQEAECLTASSMYETEPMGPQDQPDYLNSVCRINYNGTPQLLLKSLKSIEQAHGRVMSSERWTARPLDLDILLFGDQVINQANLQIPHVGIKDRSFVLWPLYELDATLVIPGYGPVEALRVQCPQFGIKKIGNTNEVIAKKQ